MRFCAVFPDLTLVIFSSSLYIFASNLNLRCLAIVVFACLEYEVAVNYLLSDFTSGLPRGGVVASPVDLKVNAPVIEVMV